MRTRRWLWLAIALVVIVGFGLSLLNVRTDQHSNSWLRDEHGRAIVPHGFNTASSAKHTSDGLPEFTIEDLDQEQADMGTNFVRFLISWRAVEPEPGVYDTEYLSAVDERVSWYATRGYHVMLDMHQDLWGNAIKSGGNEVGNGAPAWATHTDGQKIGQHDMWELYYLDGGVIRAFDNFWNTTGKHPELMGQYANAWRAVAEYFADNPAVVAYDLMNEPYGGTLQGPRFESGPLSDLYQMTADKIREVDSDSWICLEPQAAGFNWGTTTGLRHIKDARDSDPRIAFCPHLYPLPMDLGGGFVGGNKKAVESTMKTWRGNVMRTAKRLGDVPIILGEFGLDTNLPGAIDYVEAVYAMTDDMGAGVTYWSRDPGSWGPYESDGTARNLVAALDRPYPRLVAGDPLNWESTTGRLELTLVPNENISAPTEIYLPPKQFKTTPKVDGARLVDWDADSGIALLEISGKVSAKTIIITAN